MHIEWVYLMKMLKTGEFFEILRKAAQVPGNIRFSIRWNDMFTQMNLLQSSFLQALDI